MSEAESLPSGCPDLNASGKSAQPIRFMTAFDGAQLNLMLPDSGLREKLIIDTLLNVSFWLIVFG